MADHTVEELVVALAEQKSADALELLADALELLADEDEDKLVAVVPEECLGLDLAKVTTLTAADLEL